MVDFEILSRLMRAFPQSFINYKGEIILHRYANVYICLQNCETELDVKCKILEWCSRSASCAMPYRSKAKNKQFHEFMLNGINEYLGTAFTTEDMETIYNYLGNAIKHEKTIEFIEKTHYNMDFFDQFKDR